MLINLNLYFSTANYCAAFGTIFLFVGYYCIKSVFQNQQAVHVNRMSSKTKVMLVLSAFIALVSGAFLIYTAFPKN